MNLPRVRVIKNRFGSARAALDRWLNAGLWGNPMQLGPDKFHVYGANRRTWHPMYVEFLPTKIVVMIPNRK